MPLTLKQLASEKKVVIYVPHMFNCSAGLCHLKKTTRYTSSLRGVQTVSRSFHSDLEVDYTEQNHCIKFFLQLFISKISIFMLLINIAMEKFLMLLKCSIRRALLFQV